MSRTSLLNGAAVSLALVASVAMATRAPRSASTEPDGAQRVTDLTDATGVTVQLRDFRRIVSASTVADRLLLELCPRDRVVAFTARSAEGPDGHRFAGATTIGSLDDTEAILALRPDLVLTHNVAARRRVERLREAGLTVFDLGALEGRRTLTEDIRQIAALCGAPERGARYAERFDRRLDRLAPGTPSESALYVSVYADRLYGGARGTSYHDVIVAAGLRDLAAHLDGWPQYDAEQLLTLDPDLIVTREGMRATLCDHPLLSRLRACDGAVIELDGDLLDDPGVGMLDAAEQLRERLNARTAEAPR